MVAGYLVLKWLHILAAAYLVGAIVTEGLLTSHARKVKDPAVRRSIWHFLVKGEEKVAIPVAAILLFSGLLMVFGPFSGGWSMTGDLWVGLSTVLFFVLLALMAGVAGTAAKRALAAYEGSAGATGAAAHEKRYFSLLFVGGALAVFVVWLMVVKPF